MLRIQYYDSYVHASLGVPDYAELLGSLTNEPNSANVKGLGTVSRVKVLDDPSAGSGQAKID